MHRAAASCNNNRWRDDRQTALETTALANQFFYRDSHPPLQPKKFLPKNLADPSKKRAAAAISLTAILFNLFVPPTERDAMLPHQPNPSARWLRGTVLLAILIVPAVWLSTQLPRWRIHQSDRHDVIAMGGFAIQSHQYQRPPSVPTLLGDWTWALATWIGCTPPTPVTEAWFFDPTLDDQQLRRLSTIDSLIKLRLPCNEHVTADGLRALQQLPSLQSLHVIVDGCTPESLRALRELTHLRELRIEGKNLTEVELQQLRSFRPTVLTG
jgi:hypothetical protein